ncbi:uncharacterized protein LOC118488936 [Helianthus annuus]|uniref:uncharacterized protein LOC118488936 n=1 Tax=Helianthus annuus TaxID=4232 RepID=UPI001652E845|nr:uncharacterized protein LOC118488936 [Helianthus annuus]
MIFMDQEGTKMQAFVLQKNTTGYEHLLKENQCLTIRNPSMGENRQKVKYVHTSFKINLNPNTTVQECNEPVGAEWGFDFSPFDSIVDDPQDDSKSFKSPIDVIGFVVKCLPSDDKSDNNNGKDEKKTTFILEDLQHHQIYVTLWGCYADQILDFEKNNKDEKNVVVVVQFGKYRFWGGNMYVSNLYNVTRVLINSEVKEIMDFKKRMAHYENPLTPKKRDWIIRKSQEKIGTSTSKEVIVNKESQEIGKNPPWEDELDEKWSDLYMLATTTVNLDP